MQPVWGKVAGLWVGYDFAFGHATIKVPLRYCSRMSSRQHAQSHSVLQEGLPGCPVPLGNCSLLAATRDGSGTQ